jgi:hypothetical protein
VAVGIVGGRTPLETEDRDDAPAGPATLLDGDGGRTGFGTDEPLTAPELAATTIVDDEVRVTGQTVVETGTIIVLTGQSLTPGPQL